MATSQFAKVVGIYISMPPGNARGLSSSCSSEMRASVVNIKPAIDAAFCNEPPRIWRLAEKRAEIERQLETGAGQASGQDLTCLAE